MRFIKSIAMRVLSDEIKEVQYLKDRNVELRGKVEELENKLLDKSTEISKINLEKISAEQRAKKIEEENEILRKYYSLDEEPSDEIKTKIHINLEINRLKEENFKLLALHRQSMCTPIPYQVYAGCGICSTALRGGLL